MSYRPLAHAGFYQSAGALEAPSLRRRGAHLTPVITQTFTNARVVPLGAVILMAYSISLRSAEQVLDLHLKNSNRSWNRQRLSYAIRLSDDENVHAILYLLHGVRAAGSWRGFVNTRYYQPLARLRGLASRGHATTEDRLLASLFALPHRPFRVVLSYWRVLPSWFFSPRSIRGANN